MALNRRLSLLIDELQQIRQIEDAIPKEVPGL